MEPTPALAHRNGPLAEAQQIQRLTEKSMQIQKDQRDAYVGFQIPL
jgi:hypothetical protein